MNILLIDNYDSFTFNLYQQIERLGGHVSVKKHDEISLDDVRPYDAIVISPGPKSPSSAGISCDCIREFYDKKPILGVCLGHQCIGEVFGAKTVRAPQVMHGKTTDIIHNGDGVFRGGVSPMTVARYHSLVIDKIPNDLELTAWTPDGVIMGIRHLRFPVFGVQFHPESFLTNGGDILITNFLHANY